MDLSDIWILVFSMAASAGIVFAAIWFILKAAEVIAFNLLLILLWIVLPAESFRQLLAGAEAASKPVEPPQMPSCEI